MLDQGESTIGGQAVQTVNARELWEFLGLTEKFADWVQRQIKRVRLEEHRSYMGYVSFQENLKPEVGSSVRTEYHFTLDAAKHIAMMTGTDKGFEVRDYFIECEKRALAVTASLPSDPIMAMAPMDGVHGGASGDSRSEENQGPMERLSCITMDTIDDFDKEGRRVRMRVVNYTHERS